MLQDLVNQWCTTNVSFVVIYMQPMQKSAFAINVPLYLPGKQEWIVLLPVNRVSDLIRTNKLDSNFKNENYCKERFGMHATQVIMDAIDSSNRR